MKIFHDAKQYMENIHTCSIRVTEASKFSSSITQNTERTVAHSKIDIFIYFFRCFAFKAFAKWMLFLCVGVVFHCECKYIYMYILRCFMYHFVVGKTALPLAFHFHFPDCLNGDNKPKQTYTHTTWGGVRKRKRSREGERQRKKWREKKQQRKHVTSYDNLDILDFMAESRLIEYTIVLFYFMFILFFILFFLLIQSIAIYFYY